TTESAFAAGRPLAGIDALHRELGADSMSFYAVLMQQSIDSRFAEEWLLRGMPGEDLPAAKRGLPWTHPVACNVALARLQRGDTTGVAAILASQPRLDDNLPAAEVVKTVRRGVPAQAAICAEVAR